MFAVHFDAFATLGIINHRGASAVHFDAYNNIFSVAGEAQLRASNSGSSLPLNVDKLANFIHLVSKSFQKGVTNFCRRSTIINADWCVLSHHTAKIDLTFELGRSFWYLNGQRL